MYYFSFLRKIMNTFVSLAGKLTTLAHSLRVRGSSIPNYVQNVGIDTFVYQKIGVDNPLLICEAELEDINYDTLYLDVEKGNFDDIKRINNREYYKKLRTRGFPMKDSKGRKYSIICAHTLAEKYDLDATSMGSLYERSNGYSISFNEALKDLQESQESDGGESV